ncbi:MAG: hypothetical protein F6K56_29990, partial [Moorea sp. SIO3G5]|nr:hypothetical protein [Moorena sp. SIO3G5]
DQYSYWELAMTPQQFYVKWNVTYEDIALICSRSTATVQRWFYKTPSNLNPNTNDLRHLALMDFFLEHFEEIPGELLKVLGLVGVDS